MKQSMTESRGIENGSEFRQPGCEACVGAQEALR